MLSAFKTSSKFFHTRPKVVPPERFRRAMGCFASGVTVVTAAVGDEIAGLTANAFSSVSLDPPMVLVCVDRRARSQEIIRRAGQFAVHILTSDQEEVARRFARPGPEKFEGLGWAWDAEGMPRLDRYLARMSCRLSAVHAGGDHAIFLGEVAALDSDERPAAPLTYFQGRLGALRLGHA
jgi:flavin reductase (DIM6/NTAB) family NADH-FMN oxidoreductase RutF